MTCVLLLSVLPAYTQGSDPAYVYDSLGQLVVAYDAAGNAALYSYDGVGNLLSITNYPSTQFTALELSSNSSTGGSTITVYGTDFCSSPAITFNGVAATIVSATSTQIAVTVPAGTSTGPVIVTCGSNQATAGTITVASNVPSISGFTPTIGSPGTEVTVSGSNFQADVTYDAVLFNATRATAASANTSALNASVPRDATTGHISVATPYGQSSSSGYFFVPPPPATVSRLAITQQMTIGGPAVNVSLSTAATQALYAFDGTSGQQISLSISNENFNGSNWADFYIFGPGGNQIGYLRNWIASGIIADVNLQLTGTYAVLVVPESNNTGSVTLQLFNTPDQTGTITADGAPVDVSISTPGQDDALSFSATAGEQVTLYLTNTNFNGSNWIDVYIIQPGGSKSNPTASLRTWVPTNSISNVTLPSTGTYTVFVDPEGANIGSVTLQLYDLSARSLAVRGTFSDGNPNGTSISLNLPSNIQSGDLSVIGLNSLSSATFTAPSGWQSLLDAAGIGVFYKIYHSGDPASNVTFTASQSAYLAAEGITYIGADQNNPIDTFNSWIFEATNAGPYPAYSRAPTLNPHYKGSQVLCGFFGNSFDGSAFTVPQGLAPQISDSPGPNILFADEAVVDGAPTGNFDAAGGSAGAIWGRGGFQLAIKAAGASAAVTQPAPPSIGGELVSGYVSANGPVQLDLSTVAVQNNDLVIIAFIPDNSTSISPPAGYSAIDSPPGNAAIFQHVWQTGDPTTLSFSFSGSSGYVTPVVWLIRGSGTGSAPQLDQHALNYSASATSIAAPSLTPTGSLDLLLLLFGNSYNSGGSWTAPSGPTFDATYGGGPNYLIGSVPLTNTNPTPQYSAGFNVGSQMWAFAVATTMPQ